MNEPETAHVVILAANEALADRWADALSSCPWHIQRRPDTPPEPDAIDLIVTDSDKPLLPTEGPGCWTPASRGGGHVGVVRIGGHGPADVQLAADASPREIQLACRLLLEIVRLRRTLRASEAHSSRLAIQALCDPLTGLPNRRAWDETLANRLGSPSRPDGRLAVAILDLDHFKEINDLYGHAVGDEVLRLTAEAIRGQLRHDDFVARLGGDEFGLLVWVPDERAAATVLDRVRRQLPARLAESATPSATASIGFWISDKSALSILPSPGVVFEAADSALREAKQSGRNRTIGVPRSH